MYHSVHGRPAALGLNVTLVRTVDLTQAVNERTAVWPGSPMPAFSVTTTIARDGAFARNVRLNEHTGTHVDAPAHFDSGGATVERLAASRLVRPLAVVDISDRCAEDRDYGLTVEDLDRDVEFNGSIAPGSIVAARTGWDAHVGTPDYVGDPPCFPGFSAPAAERLIRRFEVEALAIDTPSIDPGRDERFEVHSTLTLPAGVWHVEGLVNLGDVPARGALIVVGVLPLARGSGAPARVIALVPD